MQKKESEFLKHRWQKVILITISVLIVLALCVLIFGNTLLTPIIAKRIRNGVIEGSDSLYRVSFSRLSLHILSGRAELEDISLTPDTDVFHRRQRQGDAPSELYTAGAKRLVITGAHPFRYLFKKEFHIAELSLVDPEIGTSHYAKEQSKPKEKKGSTLYHKISGSLKMIRVDLISLEHIRLNYRDLSGARPASYRLKEMSLRATDLLIDSATQKDTLRTLFCQDITTGISNFSGISAEGTYRYRLKSAGFSTRSARLKFTGIELKPISADAFFAKTKQDRFGLKLDSVVLDHFNFRTFQLGHYLEVKKLTVSRGGLSIYSNPHSVIKRTDRVVTFPNYVLRKMNTGLDIDTLDLRAINVSYTEFNKTAGKEGSVKFMQTSARFLNITNQKGKLRRNNRCRAKLSTLFMGRGMLDLSFTFNLNGADYPYSYQGHLAAMPLEAVNSVMMPLALIEITSGQLSSLDFSIRSTQKASSGTLKLIYHDLDLRLLGSGQQEGYHSKPLKTLLANTLIIKHDNPDKGSSGPRSAKIVYLRPNSHPFFESIWETLLSGIKPCAGVGYALKNDHRAPLTKKEQNAKKRALKKAEKEKKKADKKQQKQLKKQGASS